MSTIIVNDDLDLYLIPGDLEIAKKSGEKTLSLYYTPLGIVAGVEPPVNIKCLGFLGLIEIEGMDEYPTTAELLD